jgi:phenylalanyl-tRNA synthetase beta chain
MLISEKWLRQWSSPKLDTEELSEILTMAGLEVAGISDAAPRLGSKLVVGEVIECERHPHSSKLQICRVNVGRKRPLKVICGAPNVSIGVKTAVALIGARLPNGIKIEKTRIRDMVSSGMLCSSAELGLDDDSAGIMELDKSAVAGVALTDYLELDDRVIELDLTPNRGDCLSIAGVAREVSALTGAGLKTPKFKTVKEESKQRIPIRLEARKDCPLYIGRIIEDIDPGAKTPDWIKERLRRSGLRPISPVVDVTNYVMLELGQPMHAFDLDNLQGGIVVRHATKGEKLRLLDGSEIDLTEGSLLICDQERPIALAGIMGGEGSGISETTTTLLLESAWFRPGAIAGRARYYGMQTDASHRFERGVDPALQARAIHRATSLMLSIVGGRPGPLLEGQDKRYLPKRDRITLRYNRVEQVIGIKIPEKKVDLLLRRLEMHVRRLRRGWDVIPPSWRFDISGEHDLVEEVARLYGYNEVPDASPRAKMVAKMAPEKRVNERLIRQTIINLGYHEAITYSFVDDKLQKLLQPEAEVVKLANPIASGMSVMRVSLWSGLLQAMMTNYNRQHRRIRLFEIGHTFTKVRNKYKEVRHFSALITGDLTPEQWGSTPKGVDFFDLKGDVEHLLGLTGRVDQFSFLPAKDPALHPGQCAEVYRGKEKVGILGQLHPDLQKSIGVDQPVFLFELKLDPLQRGVLPKYHTVSRFPATRRDLALVVNEEVSASRVVEEIRRVAGQTLSQLQLFDVYRGEGIEKYEKSIAVGLTLRSGSRTLDDSEVDAIVASVVKRLASEFGAKLR